MTEFRTKPGLVRTRHPSCRSSAPRFALRLVLGRKTHRNHCWIRPKSISARTPIHPTKACRAGLPILADAPSNRPTPCGFWPPERKEYRKTRHWGVTDSCPGASSRATGKQKGIGPARLHEYSHAIARIRLVPMLEIGNQARAVATVARPWSEPHSTVWRRWLQVDSPLLLARHQKTTWFPSRSLGTRRERICQFSSSLLKTAP